MTGAAFNGSTIYAFGNVYGSTTEFSIHKYTTAGSSAGQYMNQLDFPGLEPAVFDIAWSDQGMWVARDESDSPVLRYNTSGELTGCVLGSDVPAAAGLAVDDEGYLWISDPVNDKIYKVDTTTSIYGAETAPVAVRSLQPASNPFTSTALINAGGFADGASVEVFDIRGRLLRTGSLQNGSYTLNGAGLPAGAYMVRVTDNGGSSTVRVCRTGS